MCGIIGITMRRGNATSIIVEGLKRLEYRGYDSVGVALQSEGRVEIRKAKGTIDSFVRKASVMSLRGQTGIGHTRWATHGPPNDVNAHPHTDCRGEIAVVHNGVIRNYSSLREELATRGHRIISDTDTELIAHLLEEEASKPGSMVDALARTLSRLQGSYALAILYSREPGRVYFAKMHSPLILALGEGSNAVASDITAVLDVSRRIIPLNDGEFGWIGPEGVEIYRLTPAGYTRVPQSEVESRIKFIEWTPEAASKAGYPHFMIKEIYEQPQAVMETFNGAVDDPALAEASRLIAGARDVLIVAAGTSYHAGLVFSYHLYRLARRHSIPLIASEYKQYSPAVGEDTVVVAVSQSGETYDTLAAVREYQSLGARVVGVTNVVGSALDRVSDITVYTRAGPEIGVAATKTYLAQVTILTLLAGYTGEATGALDRGAREVRDPLSRVHEVVNDAIRSSEPYAKQLAGVEGSMYILGRGLGSHIAREAALKVKEIAYLHAEAYPAGESKHGPIALVEPGFPVFIVATSDSPEVAGNAIEMYSRGGRVIVTKPADMGLEIPRGIEVLDLPPSRGDPVLEPFILAPFYQLLAYYAAVKRGYDPDKPRNLAKTVTVE
ncbi:MAG: glutamine--fructose-6-phosphate transaminase (isomerizing) [Desulfurococcales archaeon]|nr:glutamine--fructose-6-phosphate transaminase (isomerizing) [Desulfurococcales archaeon]MCE4605516.1 glutamine--fructose-6-phosphate transaminase (isomerizing) [Desulfurococcales archaeon]